MLTTGRLLVDTNDQASTRIRAATTQVHRQKLTLVGKIVVWDFDGKNCRKNKSVVRHLKQVYSGILNSLLGLLSLQDIYNSPRCAAICPGRQDQPKIIRVTSD